MNPKHSLPHLVATLSIALATSTALAQSAPEADEGSEAAATSAAPTANHCVASIAPVAQGAKASAMGKVSCYASFSAAMAAATANSVNLPSDASPRSVTESDLASATRWVIGIDYDGTYYRGASFIWYASDGYYGCYGGLSYVANMPDFLNNRLSSTKGFTGCHRNTSYDGYWQTGDWVRCFPNCVNVGGFMTNRASSKKWAF